MYLTTVKKKNTCISYLVLIYCELAQTTCSLKAEINRGELATCSKNVKKRFPAFGAGLSLSLVHCTESKCFKTEIITTAESHHKDVRSSVKFTRKYRVVVRKGGNARWGGGLEYKKGRGARRLA